MPYSYLPLFVLAAAAETATHTLLRKAALKFEHAEGFSFFWQLVKSKLAICGIALFLMESVIWVFLLSHLPLSVAFPMTGLQKLFLCFSSIFILREKILPIEYLGVLLTIIGIWLIVQP